ncbi:Esterase E4 [Camponotus japonicus]
MNKLEVCVTEGKLIGIVEESIHGDHYIAFRGIPYAKPPVGELRFKDPVPPEPWFGSRDASKYGNVAVQVDIFTNEVIGDEDCLYLNVFTMDTKPLKKRAVIVWIHGGGFFMGSGDAFLYGPDHIIRKDVVLVTLNYRLGVLGFLNLYNKMAEGNQGLKDIVMALKWIKRNISQFGGDPDNVTIFGESAGGAIVHCLTISPLAEGLIHKAISQSGVMTNPWSLTERGASINNGLRVAEKLGKATSDTEVAYKFFKEIDARKLRKAEIDLFLPKTNRLNLSIAFTPTVDSESSNPFLPVEPSKLLYNGIKMPIIFGYNSCEANFFLRGKFFGYISEETLKEIDSDFKKAIHPKILRQLPEIPITISELRALYFGNKAVSEETIMNYSDFLGDQCFYKGIMEAVDIQMSSGANEPIYLYKFSYESKTSPMKNILDMQLPGTAHFEELGYLFYPYIMKDLGLSPAAPDSEDYKIINCLTQMWTDFAKTGNPTPANEDSTSVKWTPLINGNAYHYLNINIKPQMETLCKAKQRWDWQMTHKL